HLSVRNSIHQSGLDYAALVTNWPWSTLRLDAAAAKGTKWARTWLRNKERCKEKEKERRRARARGSEREETLLGFRHRASARSSNEEGGRSNAPRWRWLKAGCLSSFHLCLPPPRLSRTSLRPKRGLEAASSSRCLNARPTENSATQRELSSLRLLREICSRSYSSGLFADFGKSRGETRQTRRPAIFPVIVSIVAATKLAGDQRDLRNTLVFPHVSFKNETPR
ncbi:hypothetical protein X777_14573, partial [Ooceraea biroi]